MDKSGLALDKYSVQRTDGRSGPDEKHEFCHYFVIDLDHDPCAVAALEAYAAALHGRRGTIFAEDIRVLIASLKLRGEE